MIILDHLKNHKPVVFKIFCLVFGNIDHRSLPFTQAVIYPDNEQLEIIVKFSNYFLIQILTTIEM